MAIVAAYVVYSLVRGGGHRFYAYPFFNPGRVGGYGGVTLYCLGMLVGFVVIALLVRWSGNALGADGRTAPARHCRATRVSACQSVLLAIVDDVLSAALKASAKTGGASSSTTPRWTPQYVQGLSPARELPVVGRIALGSLFNKFVIIIPLALLLSAFAPWVCCRGCC